MSSTCPDWLSDECDAAWIADEFAASYPEAMSLLDTSGNVQAAGIACRLTRAKNLQVGIESQQGAQVRTDSYWRIDCATGVTARSSWIAQVTFGATGQKANYEIRDSDGGLLTVSSSYQVNKSFLVVRIGDKLAS